MKCCTTLTGDSVCVIRDGYKGTFKVFKYGENEEWTYEGSALGSPLFLSNHENLICFGNESAVTLWNYFDNSTSSFRLSSEVR